MAKSSVTAGIVGVVSGLAVLVGPGQARAGVLAVAANGNEIHFFDTETGDQVGDVFDMSTIEANGSIFALDYDMANGDLWVGLHGPKADMGAYVHVLRNVAGTLQSVDSFTPAADGTPNVYDIEVVAGLTSPTTQVYVSHNFDIAYEVSLTRYDGAAATTLLTTSSTNKGFEGLAQGTGDNLWLMSGGAHRDLNNRRFDRDSTTTTVFGSSTGDSGRGAAFYPGTVNIGGVETTGVVLVGTADLNGAKVRAYAEDGTFLGQLDNNPVSGLGAGGAFDLEVDENNLLYILSNRTGGEFTPQVATYDHATDTSTTFKLFSASTTLNAVSYYVPEPASLALLGAGLLCLPGRRKDRAPLSRWDD